MADKAVLSAYCTGRKDKIMKTWYLSTFKSLDGKYYTNLVLTGSEEKTEEHYSKYDMVSIRIADESEVNSYRSKGMPIVEL